MLIEFRVENHRSIRDEQVLTLEAANLGDDDDPRPRKVLGHNKPLLPAAAIYGANASGKSNVLSAFFYFIGRILFSHKHWNPSGGILRSPFGWGDALHKPSAFEATFVAHGTRFEYGFVVDDNIVQEEWLFAWPHGRKQNWFERDGMNYRFGHSFRGPNELIQSVTRPNALFTSAAMMHNHSALFPIREWCGMTQFHSLPNIDSPITADIDLRQSAQFVGTSSTPARIDDAALASVRKILKLADLGIRDIRFVEDSVTGSRVILKHVDDNEDSWLDLSQESQGTQTLWRFAWKIVLALRGGGRLIVDELESSLHPSLAEAIINLFNNPETNPNNAQLIFTTHDTNLLGTTLGKPVLRRDQIWFTEKDDEGATKLYPLTDYKPRNVENLERGYLQGRYGAVPFLGDFHRIAE